MKYILFALLILLPLAACFGQETEISVQISSGFSYYGGKSAISTPNVSANDTEPLYLVSSPYSRKSGLPYGFAMQVQRLSESQTIFGVKVGYDSFSSTAHFDSIGTMSVRRVKVENGKVNLKNNLLLVNPYLGRRLLIKKMSLDITVGAKIGSILKSTYTVSYKDEYDFVANRQADNYRINTKIDFGPTVALATAYKRVGLQASYCYGLVNYMRDPNYLNSAQAYSRYLRLGASYRIK